MNSLASFPKELLLDILHYHPSSSYVITLWKTGDRLLQHKLENSVTSITLEDKSKLPASKWPSCLSRFHHLRNLSLTLDNGRLCGDPSSLHTSLLGLSLELEELTIVSQDSLTSSTEHLLDPNAPNFARLRKLTALFRLVNDGMPSKADSASRSFYRFLVRHVTDFSMLLLHDWEIDLIALPPNITRLNSATTNYASPEARLPSSLTSINSLVYENSSPYELAKFNPTELRLNEFIWSPQDASRCPPSVNSLSLRSISRGYPGSNLWTQSIPRNLVSLDAGANALDSANAVFLPSSLTHLSASYVPWPFQAGFPLHNLVSLRLHHFITFTLVLALPPSLTSIRVKGGGNRIMPAFPDSVTDIHSEHGFFFPLPPNLTKLKIPRLYSPKNTLLPATLTSLDCEATLVRRDAKLAVSNVRSLTLKHFSVRLFPYLPRGLTSLDIQHFETHYLDGDVQVRAWSKLPKSLTSFKAGSIVQNTILARSLAPLTELRTLCLRQHLKADFVQLLPTFTRLRSAWFHVWAWQKINLSELSKIVPAGFKLVTKTTPYVGTETSISRIL